MSMSCDSATSPINVSMNSSEKCSMKCAYSFNYPITNLTVVNEGEYYRFGPDPQAVPPVVYNNDKYVVQEMRLYAPSLHRYGGQQNTAELVIVHDNLSGGRGLLVCIPLIQNGPITDASAIVDELIRTATQRAPAQGASGGTIPLPTFTFGKLVPYGKPFFSYQATLPYKPCTGSVNIVVLSRDSAIGITAAIGTTITANQYVTHNPPTGVFYNAKGASNSAGSGGDIYIECQPTGEDGEILVDKTVDTSWMQDLLAKFPGAGKVAKGLFIAILVGLGVYFVWRAFGKVGVKAAEDSPRIETGDINRPGKETPLGKLQRETRQALAAQQAGQAAKGAAAADAAKAHPNLAGAQIGMGMGMGMPGMGTGMGMPGMGTGMGMQQGMGMGMGMQAGMY